MQSVIAIGTHCLLDGEDETGEPEDMADLILTPEYRCHALHRDLRGQRKLRRLLSLSKPGGAVFSVTDEATSRIMSAEMPFIGKLEFNCSQTSKNSLAASPDSNSSISTMKRRAEEGMLTLHGWYFNMETGALLAYSFRPRELLLLVCPLNEHRQARQ